MKTFFENKQMSDRDRFTLAENMCLSEELNSCKDISLGKFIQESNNTKKTDDLTEKK